MDRTAASGLPRKINNISLATGDFDRDGDPDLFVGAHNAQNQLYLNDGKGRFKEVTARWMPPDAKLTAFLEVADLNGDGWPDVVAGNAAGGQTKSTQRVLLGDFDRDGDIDVVIVNLRFGERLELYLNDGKAGFANRSDLVPSPGRSFSANTGCAADIDGDGDLDLCLVGQDDCQKNAFRYFENVGRARFVDATARALPRADMIQNAWGLAPGDFDGDADVDLLLLQMKSICGLSSPILLLNLRRHMIAPGAAILGKPYTLELFADQGHVILPALAAASRRLPAGGLGTFWLDPAATILLPGVGIPASRTAKLSVPLPNDPFLKGKTIWYQGLDFVPSKPAASRLTGAGSDVIK